MVVNTGMQLSSLVLLVSFGRIVLWYGGSERYMRVY